MSKIVKIQDSVILIGLDNGSIKEVRKEDLSFEPTLGMMVDIFENESCTIITPVEMKIPKTVISKAYLPPNSTEGIISPKIAAESITPEANDSTISENLCDTFLNKNPNSAPIIVAPPTPSAVNNTISII